MTHHHNKSTAAGHGDHASAADKDKEKSGHGHHAPDRQHEKDHPSGKNLAGVTAELHEEVKRERDEYIDSLQRLQAEFANFRKRVLRDSEQQSQQASIRVIEELLPVLDNFERAIKAAAEHDEKQLESGVELVYSQLREILNKRGLCEIEADGATFDPNQHEAILCRPSKDRDEGTVLEVLEKGYQVDEKVVRPAKVIVSTSPEEEK